MLASNMKEMTPNLNQVVFTLNGGVVNWKSSKQETTIDSTNESEYIVAFEATKEVV